MLVCGVSIRPANCASIGLNLYGISYHLDRDAARRRNFNEFNEGIGLHLSAYEDRYNFVYLEAGRFKDTFENGATYYAVGYRFRPIKYISLGLNFMQYDSKSIRNRVYTPIPVLAFDYKIASVKMSYLPKYRDISSYDSFVAYLTLRLVKLR